MSVFINIDFAWRFQATLTGTGTMKNDDLLWTSRTSNGLMVLPKLLMALHNTVRGHDSLYWATVVSFQQG